MGRTCSTCGAIQKFTQRFSGGKSERKRPLGKPRRRWEDNVKMDSREVGCHLGDWIALAEDRDQWRAYVRVGLPYVLIFPDMSSFSRVILPSGQNFQNQRKCLEIGLKHFNFYFRALSGEKKVLQW